MRQIYIVFAVCMLSSSAVAGVYDGAWAPVWQDSLFAGFKCEGGGWCSSTYAYSESVQNNVSIDEALLVYSILVRPHQLGRLYDANGLCGYYDAASARLYDKTFVQVDHLTTLDPAQFWLYEYWGYNQVGIAIGGYLADNFSDCYSWLGQRKEKPSYLAGKTWPDPYYNAVGKMCFLYDKTGTVVAVANNAYFRKNPTSFSSGEASFSESFAMGTADPDPVVPAPDVTLPTPVAPTLPDIEYEGRYIQYSEGGEPSLDVALFYADMEAIWQEHLGVSVPTLTVTPAAVPSYTVSWQVPSLLGFTSSESLDIELDFAAWSQLPFLVTVRMILSVIVFLQTLYSTVHIFA